MVPAHIVHGESVVNIVVPRYNLAGKRPIFSRQSVYIIKEEESLDDMAENRSRKKFDLSMSDCAALLNPSIPTDTNHDAVGGDLNARAYSIESMRPS